MIKGTRIYEQNSKGGEFAAKACNGMALLHFARLRGDFRC